jgi:hypothetical protein
MTKLSYQSPGTQELVRVQGTHYEQGLALGQATSALIHENIHRKRELLETLNDSEATAFWNLVKQNEAFMQGSEPGLFEELTGMAKGAGVHQDDLLLMNFHWFIRAREIANECSCFFARSGATDTGKTYLGKTRDQQNPETHVVVERRYPSGLTVLEVMAAGAPAFPPAGINSHGLAIVSSGVWSDYAAAELGRTADSYVMANLRLLLRNAQSVSEAVEVLRQFRYVAGINLTAVDANQGALIEIDLDMVQVTHPGDVGILTNHYVSEGLRSKSMPRDQYPSTYLRYERLQQLMHENHGDISFRHMLAFLQDHERGPQNSICRHATGVNDQDQSQDKRREQARKPETGQSISQVGLIMIVEEGELWATLVNPCEAIKRVAIN